MAVLPLLLGFALTLFGTVPVRGGDLINKIKNSGKLVVAQVDVDMIPFFWKKIVANGKSEWVGYEMDLARSIAEKLGVNLEILRLGDDYNEVCNVVAKGEADLGISNLSDTEARRKLADFSKPYIVSRVGMVVDLAGLEQSGIDAIAPEDLNRPDVKIALTPNSGYDFVYQELMPKATRVGAEQGDFDDLFRPVLEGKAHAVIDDGFTLFMGMNAHPEYSPRYYFHIFDQYDDPLSMCLPKDQPEMREFLNGMIDEIEAKEPVTLELLVERYVK